MMPHFKNFLTAIFNFQVMKRLDEVWACIHVNQAYFNAFDFALNVYLVKEFLQNTDKGINVVHDIDMLNGDRLKRLEIEEKKMAKVVVVDILVILDN